MPPNRWCQIEGIDNHHRKSVVSHNLVHHAGYSTLLFRLIPIFRKNTLGLPFHQPPERTLSSTNMAEGYHQLSEEEHI
ncbi:hypothetical protein TNCV_3963951 [Trichonephila clavipes]|nr:hypothetical protein TNCV_4875971 [Trichonephila clavipes]GFV64985.1 hypothetical protein TNCV_3963951 [Trichonephila clavipes]